jgi:hypothetical protein
MLRICVLTVFGETDNSPAISGRDSDNVLAAGELRDEPLRVGVTG